ncbi:phosphatidate cytidylyltransferase [Celeribacter indicus]|uniref:Phosphatidate cytidylyltransferase n=1 Tax=Celeribacter indicus TaxID=1208324 RepID=A0A0B5DV92_9RHOB|nr:phosphatidate cytidylyltransferase [Celeribacter indicus]AJE47333.1 phosphatidate cytidylyltransferase [Celeribacter indicus]SDW03747.1 phosphatidate cytidylyltransferase [Celeribacter indicus]
MTRPLPDIEIAPKKSKWRDLMPRVLSAIVMIALGLGAILSGHAAFRGLVIVAGLIGLWELTNMYRLRRDAFGFGGKDALALGGYALILLLGCLGLVKLSAEGGRAVLLYAIGLVVVTDSLGYLVGKAVGGPKFWPRVSPKKTWAGILGGWVGVGLLASWAHRFMPEEFVRYWFFITVSVALSFASQMGDMVESALKRRMGVKDSSNIIPGHGGVLDRFDALLALGALYYILAMIFG